jgi:hypothetical protein
MLEDQHGDIWIGANDRLTVLHPSGLTKDTRAVNIQMNNIELFNENINWISLSNHKTAVLFWLMISVSGILNLIA